MRKYPWGTVEAMSRDHSDLLSLKRLLFEVAPQALHAETERQYLLFRSGCLPELQASLPPTQLPGSFPQTSSPEGQDFGHPYLCTRDTLHWVCKCAPPLAEHVSAANNPTLSATKETAIPSCCAPGSAALSLGHCQRLHARPVQTFSCPLDAF